RAGGAGRAGCAGGRRGARGLLAAAEELGIDATIGLQAGDELLVLVAFRAHALALVARHGLAFALAGDLQAAAIDAFRLQVVGVGAGAGAGAAATGTGATAARGTASHGAAALSGVQSDPMRQQSPKGLVATTPAPEPT